MVEPVWVNDEIVPAVHNRQLAEHGGVAGIRDQGLLESALHAPKNRWQYEESSLEELAASYAFHLAGNHPFIDGNKRTAYVCMRLFLKLNGLDIEASKKEKAQMMLDLSAGKMSLETVTKWIEQRMVPL